MSVTGSSLCHTPPSCVPISIHPPTPLSPCPNLLVSFAYRYPRRVQLLACDRRERETGGKKQKKQIRLKPRALCQAIRLSLSVSWWVSWHVHDHEPTMRRGIASPWCTPLTLRLRRTQAMFSERQRGLWSHPQRQIQNKGVCMSLCVLEVILEPLLLRIFF